MNKPEWCPESIWDEVISIETGYEGGASGRRPIFMARAILSAQERAYTEAARIAEEYDGDGLSGGYDAHLGDAYLTKREISAAILHRKEEIGR